MARVHRTGPKPIAKRSQIVAMTAASPAASSADGAGLMVSAAPTDHKVGPKADLIASMMMAAIVQVVRVAIMMP